MNKYENVMVNMMIKMHFWLPITHAYSFLRLMVFYFELVELSMILENIVDKVDKEDKLVENWTRRRWIPIDSVKSWNYFGIMVIRLGAWVILIRIRPIRHTRLVKVMICQIGNIRKRGWCVIWIIIKIEKIIVISHITQ